LHFGAFAFQFFAVNVGIAPTCYNKKSNMGNFIKNMVAPLVDESKERIKLLHVEGTGVRGYISLMVLREIEQIVGKPIREIFDFFGGESSGAVISAALNMPESHAHLAQIDYLMEEYINIVRRMFVRKLSSYVTNPFNLFRACYDGEQKLKILEEFFGDVRMSDLHNTVMINAIDANDFQARIFGSKFSSVPGGENALVREVINGTTAAVTFFPSAVVKIPDSSDVYNLVDGATITNVSESLYYLTAQSMYPKAKISMVSIGGGYILDHKKASHALYRGALQWLKDDRILGAILHKRLSGELQELLIAQKGSLLEQYIKINPVLSKELSEQFNRDASYLQKIKDFAASYVLEQRGKLVEYFRNYD
jgi:patatin-like phospholipase/acyl hydrolase